MLMQASTMLPGSRVWHVAYGRGVVDGVLAGRRVLVRFDGAPGLPRTITRGELQVEGVAPASGLGPRPVPPATKTRRAKVRKATPAKAPTPATAREVADMRQTLEALRLGVVPSQHVEDYTVGRSEELRALNLLLDASAGLRALWGGYGAGKTHMLDVAEHMARARGFATARVVVDPLEMPPTHPKRLYAAIVRSLRLPDSADVGLEPLAHALCEDPEHRTHLGRSFSRFFSPFLHALHCQDVEGIAVLRDYVLGEDLADQDIDWLRRKLHQLGWVGPGLLTLSDYRTYGRVYMHLLGTLACWIRDVGHRGLLVLLDEVEYVDALPRQDLGYALEVLKHFAAATLPAAALTFDPDDPQQLYRGGHDVHRQIPLRYQVDQPLSVVCALTPVPEVQQLYDHIVADEEVSVWLRPLQPQNLDELVQRVAGLYRRGYPDLVWTAADRTAMHEHASCVHADDTAMIRRVVQRTVFALDELRYRQRLAHGA
jgi:hypothetical protein